MPPPAFAAGSLFICRDPNPAPGSDPLDNVYLLLAKQENSGVLVSFSGKIDAPPPGGKRRARSPLETNDRSAALQRYMARCIGVDQSPAPEEYDYSNTFAAVREGYEESKGVCGTCSLQDLVTYVGQRQPLATFRDDRVCMQPVFLGDLNEAQRADLEGRFEPALGFHSCMYEIESVHFCSLAAVMHDGELGPDHGPVRLPFRVKSNIQRCLSPELLRNLPGMLAPSRNGLPPLATISGGFRDWLNGALPHPARVTVEEAIVAHRRGVVARAELPAHPAHQLVSCSYCGGVSSSGNCCHVSAPPLAPVFSPLHAPLLLGFDKCADHPTIVVPSFFGVIAALPHGKHPRRTPGTILPLAPALAPHLLTVADLIIQMEEYGVGAATSAAPQSLSDRAGLGRSTRVSYMPGKHHAPEKVASCKGMLVRFIVLRGSRKVSDMAQIVEWGGAGRGLVGVSGGHHIGNCLTAWAALASRSVKTDEVAAALAQELTD